jgi:hypothetical protein
MCCVGLYSCLLHSSSLCFGTLACTAFVMTTECNQDICPAMSLLV